MKVGDGSVFVTNVWMVRRAADADNNVGGCVLELDEEVALGTDDSRKGACSIGKRMLRTRL